MPSLGNIPDQLSVNYLALTGKLLEINSRILNSDFSVLRVGMKFEILPEPKSLVRGLFALLMVLLLTACANSTTAVIYNLDSKEQAPITFIEEGNNSGRFVVVRHNGEVIKGEFESFGLAEMSFRNRMAEHDGFEEFSWAENLGFSIQQPGKRIGIANLTAKGVEFDLVFAYDPSSSKGEGVGRSNHGSTYKIVF